MIITVTSGKGGVGKTTTTSTLAAIASEQAPVVAVDFDEQGNLASTFGLTPADSIHKYMAQEWPAATILEEVLPQLQLLAGNSRTRVTEATIASELKAGQPMEFYVDRLRSLEPPHGLLFVDTKAGSVLSEVAMLATDILVIPTELEQLSLEMLDAKVSEANAFGIEDQRIVIVPTKVEIGTRVHRDLHRSLMEEYGERCIVAGIIPKATSVREASVMGLPLTQYRPARRVLEAYRLLMETIDLTLKVHSVEVI